MAAKGLSPMIVAALAHRARLDVSVVAEVLRSASAKGMRSVAWAADFNADDAFTLQIKVARVPPSEALKSRAGLFDTTLDELEWRLGLFKDPTAKHHAR